MAKGGAEAIFEVNETNKMILKRYLNWLNLKKCNRMHWLGKGKEGSIYSKLNLS